MRIEEITKNKTDFMRILLIGDEEESMVNKYLNRSTLFVLYYENTPTSVCAVMPIDDNTVEIKNLATRPEYQNKGCCKETP